MSTECLNDFFFLSKLLFWEEFALREGFTVAVCESALVVKGLRWNWKVVGLNPAWVDS